MAVGQIAVQQQKGHLVEGGVLGQLADRIAAIAQAAFDGGDGRFAGNHAFQTR